MTFNSVAYALFLPVVVLVYWALPRQWQVHGRAVPIRQLFLLAASYVFYGAWDWRFLGLLCFTTVVDYNVARALQRRSIEHQRQRRALLLVSLAVNLGVLGFFKYAGFFTVELGNLLERVGLDANLPVLHVLLPVGISFYTFQSIAYVVDVYRGDVDACTSVIDYAAFIAFFPQLVAGPISRARTLLPQLQAERRRPEVAQTWSACALLLSGLFKKVVLADSLAPIVDHAFHAPSRQGSAVLLAGAVGFGLQIYTDFSGYSDIARGSARLFDVELVRNFRQPYLSRSITEFWRRWHISLSTWLRDYLYVPLGGNRRGRLRTYWNLMVTMALGGLWHGAGWGFVTWGVLNGVYLVVERAARRQVLDDEGLPRPRHAPAILATFALACLAFVFFRAPTFGDAWNVLAGIVAGRGPAPTGGGVATVALVAVVTFALDLWQRARGEAAVFAADHPVRTGLLAGAALVSIIVFSGTKPVPFIYFQF